MYIHSNSCSIKFSFIVSSISLVSGRFPTSSIINCCNMKAAESERIPEGDVSKLSLEEEPSTGPETKNAPLSLLFQDMVQFVEDSPMLGSALTQVSEHTKMPKKLLSQSFVLMTGSYLAIGYWAEFVAKVIGLAYPAYATIHSLINPNETERKVSDSYWLRYWIVYSAIHIASFIIDAQVEEMEMPGYWLFKAVFFFWCSMPPFHGAQRIYLLTEKYVGLPYPEGRVFALRTEFPEISDPKALPIPEGSVRERNNPMPVLTGPPAALPGFRVWTDPNSGTQPPDPNLFPITDENALNAHGNEEPAPAAGFNI